MKVKVRYYGRFVTLLNKFEEELEIPQSYRVKDFVVFLKEKNPLLKNEYLEVSMGGKYAPENTKIWSEEIAVYPVISGG